MADVEKIVIALSVVVAFGVLVFVVDDMRHRLAQVECELAAHQAKLMHGFDEGVCP